MKIRELRVKSLYGGKGLFPLYNKITSKGPPHQQALSPPLRAPHLSVTSVKIVKICPQTFLFVLLTLEEVDKFVSLSSESPESLNERKSISKEPFSLAIAISDIVKGIF